ncbi:MAG: hypothetical protein QF441_00980 [Bacteriovoracaceae bacterium]|jgi:hypothetical protein|nr:hypothetical protein [Halobacteriovoraceae bacterium]MDP7319143.1 hypothetical protein [Bacteriovoracaceae bacterium]
MKKLLLLILVLSSVNCFSFSKEFEIKDPKGIKQKISLNLVVGRICYSSSLNKFLMHSYMGANRSKKFFNSCAVIEHELICLGEVGPVKRLINAKFCKKPMKFRATEKRTLYKSFTDKFACKSFLKESIKKLESHSEWSCFYDRGHEIINNIVDFQEKK